MRFLIFLGVLFFGAAALAAERADMDWADLIDQSAQEFDDPYKDLTSDQLTALVDVARLQAQVDGTSVAEERTERRTGRALGDGQLPGRQHHGRGQHRRRRERGRAARLRRGARAHHGGCRVAAGDGHDL